MEILLLFVNIKTSYLTQLYTVIKCLSSRQSWWVTAANLTEIYTPKSFFSTHITDGSLCPTDSNSYISTSDIHRAPPSPIYLPTPCEKVTLTHSPNTRKVLKISYTNSWHSRLWSHPMSTSYSNQATKLVWRNLRSSFCGQNELMFHQEVRMRIITRQLRNGLASKHRTAMKTNLWQASWYKTKRTQHPHEFNSGPQKNKCLYYYN